MKVSVHAERWPTVVPFRIAGKVWNSFEYVVVSLSRGRAGGHGEAAGVFYLNESIDGILGQIEAIVPALRAGLTREELQTSLPPGGARNAIDCALWDLEAKERGIRVWELAGVNVTAVQTTRTIGLEPTFEQVTAEARKANSFPMLKIKVDGDRPLERLAAVRSGSPTARLVVDANQAWNFAQLQEVAPAYARLGVEMIEQPLPRGADEELENYRSPVPLCADESCQYLGDLPQAASRYQMINIKLDKAGGLTHGLRLAAEARKRNLGVMVGCMGGGSLAMAPAFVLACVCDLADIDGPLLQSSDRLPGLEYTNGKVSTFGPEVWG